MVGLPVTILNDYDPNILFEHYDINFKWYIKQAKDMVAMCSYPGGRDLARLRDLANGELDSEIDDPVLAAAVRDAAWDELHEDQS